MNLKVGDNAPDFELRDQYGKTHKLSDYLGQKVLIYFYPRDFTPGCTTEACSLRDNFEEFRNSKAEVLGISIDSVESHNKFARKYNLPFTLLADVDHKVQDKYGVWQEKKFFGKKYMGTLRTSFLIDQRGKINKIYEKVRPPTHANQVLEDLK